MGLRHTKNGGPKAAELVREEANRTLRFAAEPKA
jgi:hypothetical protein